MINIISTFGRQPRTTGPGKVFANLVKGLDQIGYPYVVNRDLNATKRLWIHDDVTALSYMKRSRAFKVVGPNLVILPDDIPPKTDLQGALYVHPSNWAKQLWEYLGFNACPIGIWPVGIDTEVFRPPTQRSCNRRVMVYFKERDPKELNYVMDTLFELRLPYTLVLYGQYQEHEYLDMLSSTSFVVWLGRPESQGIALQEALACDVPILVCNATRLSQSRGYHRFPLSLDNVAVTAVPYFDDSCGLRITDLSALECAIERMLDMLDQFAPREFVLQNLTLEKQARAFVALWEQWGLTFEEGLLETAQTERSWYVPLPLPARVWAKLRRMARTSSPWA